MRTIGRLSLSITVLLAACSGGSNPADVVDTDTGVDTTNADVTSDATAPDVMSDATETADVFAPAPHRGFPQVMHVGTGGVVHMMRVVTVVAQNDDMPSQLFAFGDAAVASMWFTAMGADYGVGPAGSSVHVTGPSIAAGTTMTQTMMESYVTNAIAGGPMPDGHTLYVLYLPANVIFYYAPDMGPNTNCQFVTGYHRTFGTGGDAFAAVQRCPVRNGTLLENLTTAASHEIAEAATDNGGGWAASLGGAQPWTASVWTELEGQGHVEVGDLCVGTRIVEGMFMYQRIFSNTAAIAGGDPCVPALPIPYYSTSVPQDWYMATAGSTVMIPVTGWSTSPTSDWLVRVHPGSASGAGVMIVPSLSTPMSMTVAGMTYGVMNNETAGILSVTVPAGIASGSWGLVAIDSLRRDAMGAALPGEDLVHKTLVGVYVP